MGGEDTRSGTKVLSLGARLPYPIKITKIYKSKGDDIKKQEPILQFSIKTWGEEADSFTLEYKRTEQTTYMEWPAPSDGKLLELHLRVGDEVKRDVPCATVQEACTHEIQFQGLCAMCGRDMTEVNWATDRLDTERAPINMTHDQTRLLVSRNAAAKAELELQRRLLDQRKLSLVVDLDQTIIHACIEPTIGDWQRDPNNPNHDAVKDVRSFQLNDDGPRGLASGCWYYIKMRPGLFDFLTRIAETYELHVYTMGTRAYAMNIAKIVDPDKRLFGNRVISRDENGNMTAKSLQRIFPVSTNMVVIIDDRADVWPRNRPNLIKVVPYDFFKGIGDINSSFLPKREDLLVPSASPSPLASKGPGPLVNGGRKPAHPQGQNRQHAKGAAKSGPDAGAKPSALEELASMSGGDDAALIKKQTEEQEKTLEMQIKERPLLHMQELLDKEDKEAAGNDATTVGGDANTASGIVSVIPMHPHPRHHLLLDDDRELMYLEKHLARLHEAYFRAVDTKRTEVRLEKIADAQIRGLPPQKAEEEADRILAADPPDPPDVGAVLDGLKAQVLGGTRIVLSGLVPMGIDVELSEIGLQARSFGAQILKKVSKQVTHLVISSSRPRTLKMTQAEKIPSIKIVNQDWLIDCLSQWRHLDEAPYAMGSQAAGGSGVATVAATNDNTDAETISDGDGDTEGGSGATADSKRRRRRTKNLKIIVSTPGGVDNEEDEDSDDEDEGPDAGDGDDDEDEDFLTNGARSPIDELKTFDWGEADAEMEEFLASDDDEGNTTTNSGAGREMDEDGNTTSANDSEADSVPIRLAGRKRKLGGGRGGNRTESEDDSRLSDSGVGGANKKQRLGTVRSGSRLRVVRTPEDVDGRRANGASLPTPQGTGDEEDVLLLKGGNGPATSAAAASLAVGAADGGGGNTDIDEDLEADLMAELEAEELEEAEKDKG